MWRLIGSLCSVCKTNIISTIVDLATRMQNMRVCKTNIISTIVDPATDLCGTLCL